MGLIVAEVSLKTGTKHVPEKHCAILISIITPTNAHIISINYIIIIICYITIKINNYI